MSSYQKGYAVRSLLRNMEVSKNILQLFYECRQGHGHIAEHIEMQLLYLIIITLLIIGLLLQPLLIHNHHHQLQFY